MFGLNHLSERWGCIDRCVPEHVLVHWWRFFAGGIGVVRGAGRGLVGAVCGARWGGDVAGGRGQVEVGGCGVPGGCGGVCAGASVATGVVIRPPVRWEAELGIVPGDVTADRSVLCSTPGELSPSLAAAGSVVASVVAPGR